jgi:hypothetical protein
MHPRTITNLTQIGNDFLVTSQRIENAGNYCR